MKARLKWPTAPKRIRFRTARLVLTLMVGFVFVVFALACNLLTLPARFMVPQMKKQLEALGAWAGHELKKS